MVVDELIKTLGPTSMKVKQIKTDETTFNLSIEFSIYADFVSLRKEQRLNTLIRPLAYVLSEEQSEEDNSTIIASSSRKRRDLRVNTTVKPALRDLRVRSSSSSNDSKGVERE